MSTDNENRVKAEISEIVSEIERLATGLGPLGAVEFGDVEEIIEIFARIEEKWAKQRDLAYDASGI